MREVVPFLVSCHIQCIQQKMFFRQSFLLSMPLSDLTLEEGKGLVNLDTMLGPGKGIWALQWDCSFSRVIWLTYCRNEEHHCLLYKFQSSAHAQPRPWPIRSEVCFTTTVSARTHQAMQPNQGNSPNSPDPFPLFGVGSGHETSQQQLLKLTTAMATFSLCSNVESTTGCHKGPTNRPWWPAKQASQNAWGFVPLIQECISMATLVCAHGTAILTNSKPSEFMAEHNFYAFLPSR